MLSAFLIISFILNLYPTESHIELTPLPDNTGILPFKLGTAFINPYNHVLLDYVDLENLYNNFTTIINLEETKISKYNQDHRSYFNIYLGDHSEYKLLVKNIKTKFENIFSLNERIKRGLFNFVGSANKFLFGTLDADDGEKIYKRIESLEKSNNKIIEANNIQISLSKQLTEAYNNTVSKLVKNQEILKTKINELITAEKWNWSSFQTTFGQIISNLRFTDEILNDIENAITFSKLGIIHPSIISIKKLEKIFRVLSKYHSESTLLKINFSDLYGLIRVRSYLHEKKIVFALSIPIIYPKEYNYYKLVPIPTNENTILIPPHPYLVLSKEDHQYQHTPCIKLQDFYLCQKEEEINSIDCIVQILRNQNPSRCHFARVEIDRPVIEKVSSDTAIILTTKNITIQQNCNSEELEYARVFGKHLVKIPSNCKLIYKSLEIGNYETKLKGQPIYLPDVLINEKVIENSKLKLGKIPLTELHEISNKIEMLKPIEMEESIDPEFKWTLSSSIIIIAILLAIVAFKDRILKFLKTSKQVSNSDVVISGKTVDANLEEGGII